MMMLSCVQKPRTWLVYLQKTLFFSVFSTIFCEPRESLWTEPTMLLACRHAQIDLFTWRKWIRVAGISTLPRYLNFHAEKIGRNSHQKNENLLHI